MLCYSLRKIVNRETYSGGYFPDRLMAVAYFTKQLGIPLTFVDQPAGGADFMLTERKRSNGVILSEIPVWVVQRHGAPS